MAYVDFETCREMIFSTEIVCGYSSSQILDDISHSIETGTFSETSFNLKIFRLLFVGRGQTIIETLIQTAEYLNSQNSDSMDEKQTSTRNLYQLIMQLLANTAGKCGFRDKKKNTVLHHASKLGMLKIVEFLLKEGADPNAINEEGDTPVLLATKFRNRCIVDLLVESGADIFLSRPTDNHTLLHAASCTEWIDFVQFLLDKGVNPNATTEDGFSPLHFAVTYSRKKIVDLLLEHGADICLPDTQCSVLHLAVDINDLELVKYLVEKGADLDAENRRGFSPFSEACEGYRIEIIEYLTDAINKKNGTNEPPLKCVMKHNPDLYLMKEFVKRYGYFNFIDDYYFNVEKDKGDQFSKCWDIFTHVKVCTDAIIKKFNDKDLPAFYNLPKPDQKLPPLQNLKINSPAIINDIEQSVSDEINANQHCDLRKPKVIVLSMLAVRSYLDYYNGLFRRNA